MVVILNEVKNLSFKHRTPGKTDPFAQDDALLRWRVSNPGL